MCGRIKENPWVITKTLLGDKSIEVLNMIQLINLNTSNDNVINMTLHDNYCGVN